MNIPTLKPFDKSNWENVAAAFQDAPALEMSQAWRDTPEDGFRPGAVRLGWRDGSLLVHAQLTDDKIFTRATGDNQHLYTLGDVFELFLKDAARENYVEFHVSPNRHRLQLCFPSGQTIAALRASDQTLEDLMVSEPLFDFSVRTTATGWEVMAEVPSASLGSPATCLDGMSFNASFGRYDYTDEKTPPILSSTSAHVVPNFHHQHEWRKLTFGQPDLSGRA